MKKAEYVGSGKESSKSRYLITRKRMRKSYAYLSSHIHLTHIESNPSNLVSLHKIRKTHSDIASAFRALSYPLYRHPTILSTPTIFHHPQDTRLSPLLISHIHISTKTTSRMIQTRYPTGVLRESFRYLRRILDMNNIVDTRFIIRHTKSIPSIFSTSLALSSSQSRYPPQLNRTARS